MCDQMVREVLRDIYRISSFLDEKAPHLQLTISVAPAMQESTQLSCVIGLCAPRTSQFEKMG